MYTQTLDTIARVLKEEENRVDGTGPISRDDSANTDGSETDNDRGEGSSRDKVGDEDSVRNEIRRGTA